MKWKTKTSSTKKRASRAKGHKMTEQVKAPEVDITKEGNKGILEIRAEKGNTGRLEIFFRHPILAEVIDNMGLGNYPKAEYAKEYSGILVDFPNPKAKEQGLIATRPAILQATKNMEAATDFDFSKLPRAILFCNPEALRNGFSIFVDLKTPVAPDTLRKWGKNLMDASGDIIAASRPYKMSWVATEGDLPKV